MYLLTEGKRRPARDYEGGLIPDPMPTGIVDQAAFVAGGLVLRYLILHFVIIPFLVVWAGVMALPPLAWSKPGSHFTWYDALYLAATGLVGLRILVKIKWAVDGRPRRRGWCPTPAGARVRVRPVPVAPIAQGHWVEYRPGQGLVPVDAPLLPPGPALP